MYRKYYLNEIWVPVKGYEGLYEVSNCGRVRSLNYKKKGITQLLKTHARLGNYVKVALRKDDVVRYHRVHRLVAIAFLPPPFEGQTQVEHINCDTRDNRLENLRWTTPRNNMANPLTRYRLSISHQSPSSEIRARYSAGQKRRFLRERQMGTGRYAPHIAKGEIANLQLH